MSKSIWHGDVKSSNIILDDHFMTELSDFRISRSIRLGQTHIVTATQDTFGYLYPEYYQTSQLTEMNDIYNFRVILLALLIEKKPILSTKQTVYQCIFFGQWDKDTCTNSKKILFWKKGSKQDIMEINKMIEICLRLKEIERPRSTNYKTWEKLEIEEHIIL